MLTVVHPTWYVCHTCRQDEATGDSFDKLYAIAMGQDGSVALTGSGEHDFRVIKLDAAGNEMWRFEVPA